MFFATYKNTLKNIVRSATFWLLLALFILEIIQVIINPAHIVFDPDLKEQIMDTDPRFVVRQGTYLKRTFNAGRSLSVEILPFITAVATVLILNRDYGDNFYEIEKAAGAKPSRYLLARLTALATLLVSLGAFFSLVNFHVYIFTRGGVPSMDLLTYITDSTFRVLRTYLFVSVPTVLFYIGFTYCVGALFRNGIAAAVVSIGYVLINTLMSRFLRFRITPLWKDYLFTSPHKLAGYFDSINRADVDGMLKLNDTNLGKAVLCLCILLGLAVLYSVVAYIRTCKRDR